jgi:hypothetical protein
MTLKQIREKLYYNSAAVTRADKDNTLVILYKDNCHSRKLEFCDSNSFTVLNTDPTNSFQSRKMVLLMATAGNEVQKLVICVNESDQPAVQGKE